MSGHTFPMVSIIVLNWNGAGCLRPCLASLFEQTYPNYEVIVVDNASTDGSPEIVRKEFPPARLIINGRNLGFAAGNNIGIKAARGELVVLFNNDASADPHWLARLGEGILSSPGTGIASGPIYYREPKDMLWGIAGRFDVLSGMTWHLGQYDREVLLSNDFDYIPFCAVLIRKEVFDQIGFLDERFFISSEDVDFCLRARQAGYKLKIVADAVVWHAVSASTRKEPSRRHLLDLESEFKLTLKWLPWFYLPLSLILKLTAIPVAQVLFLGYPLNSIGHSWRACFAALSQARRNGRAKPGGRLKKSLPRVRLAECLRLSTRRCAQSKLATI
ncbi:MAG: glycosyltransferase family 2 protein [Chloroflexi bacterium]|nr:glycosyltransferase family 2 protein [Chloroflexota bacterium]